MSWEVDTPVRVIQVKRVCECDGEMKFAGYSTAGNPPHYAHQCDKCGRYEMFVRCYPVVRYEPEPAPPGARQDRGTIPNTDDHPLGCRCRRCE